MANTKGVFCFLVLLAVLAAPLATAVGPPRHHGRPNDDFGDGQGGLFGMPWFGGGAGFGRGGGGGAGFGGGWGAGGTWYRRGAVVPPSTVCADRGPCHGKRLTCPARCFRSYSYRTKNGGGGGGGGGCSFDCTHRCVASC